jgi:hypothetical protein
MDPTAEGPRPEPPPDDDDVPGVVVRYDDGLPGYQRCAIVLATLACPPRRADDPRWLEVVRAFCRLHFDEGERIVPDMFDRPQTQPVNWGHLTYPLERATKLAEDARATLNARLVASHTMMPFLWEGLGKAGKIEFRDYKFEETLESRIQKVVDQEADRHAQLSARYGEVPPPRLPMGRDQLQAKNFMTKVLRPARPVLHIVAALDHVMATTNEELRKAGKPPIAKMLEIDVHGTQVHGWFFERMPELADAVVARSWVYEQALPHLRVQRPDHPDTAVRFRLQRRSTEVSA